MEKAYRPALIFLLMALYLTGCVRLAIQFSSDLIINLSQAIFEECDPELAKASLPSDLKLMEGLLKNDPENRQILIMLCMGFTGYSMLFVEEEDQDRASLLYLRARDYGLRAAGLGSAGINASIYDREAFQNKIEGIGKEEIEALFWTTMAWNLWINLNLDKPVALSQLNSAQFCLNRVMDIDPEFFYGAPYVLMGTILAAKPAMMGGNESMAREYFEKAMDLSQGRFLLTRYFFARYYAVRTQDKALFLKLTTDTDIAPSDEFKDVCLLNMVMKEKIRHLRKMDKDLFL
ncbi:MAG: hypothetical protein JXA35_09495 [Deltaproteobacteria bacterium]|nr:hypothetical protein [Deltaproteobacteria bacterium]